MIVVGVGQPSRTSLGLFLPRPPCRQMSSPFISWGGGSVTPARAAISGQYTGYVMPLAVDFASAATGAVGCRLPGAAMLSPFL